MLLVGRERCLQKSNIEAAVGPAIPPQASTAQKFNTRSNKYTHTNVPRGTMPNREKVETARMSMADW